MLFISEVSHIIANSDVSKSLIEINVSTNSVSMLSSDKLLVGIKIATRIRSAAAIPDTYRAVFIENKGIDLIDVSSF